VLEQKNDSRRGCCSVIEQDGGEIRFVGRDLMRLRSVNYARKRRRCT